MTSINAVLAQQPYSGRTIGRAMSARPISQHMPSQLGHGGLVEALEGVRERLLPSRHLQKEYWADSGLPQVCTDGNDG